MLSPEPWLSSLTAANNTICQEILNFLMKNSQPAGQPSARATGGSAPAHSSHLAPASPDDKELSANNLFSDLPCPLAVLAVCSNRIKWKTIDHIWTVRTDREGLVRSQDWK